MNYLVCFHSNAAFKFSIAQTHLKLSQMQLQEQVSIKKIHRVKDFSLLFLLAINLIKKRNYGNPKFNIGTKKQILICLAEAKKNGRVQHGSIKAIAAENGVSVNVVARTKKAWEQSVSQGEPFPDLAPKMANTGRKEKYSDEEISELLRNTPPEKRTTMRNLSATIGIPKSTLFDYFQKGAFKVANSHLKPLLTNKNKLERLEFCHVHVVQDQEESHSFDAMFDVVHIDEKWFNITKVNKRIYLALDEEVPQDFAKSKNYLGKIMFLAAAARPRYDFSRNKQFDGKLGIWPFVTEAPAIRNSRNRPAGTLELKSLSVDSNVSRQFMLEHVIPSIKKKWPRKLKPIFIQQDNARSHVKPNDPFVVEAGNADGWKISIKHQPPNSPDFNVLDLGYFNAIQSLQYQTKSFTIPELIKAVEASFAEMNSVTLDNCFVTLMKCMEQCMLCGGGNKYKIPHMRKECLRNTMSMPEKIPCKQRAYTA